MQVSLERLENCHQLVLIAGESGTGKTALAMSVQKTKAFSQSGILLLGKFDQAKTGQEPYAAFVTAFQQLVGFLKTSKDHAKSENLFKDLQVELTSELSPLEWVALMQPFPELQELLRSEDEKEEVEQSSTKSDQEFQVRLSAFMETGTPEKEKSRFHNSFRKLMRVISEHFSPLVLVLDDLQWADFASLDLVRGIEYAGYCLLSSQSTNLPLLNSCPFLSLR
jgi:predicted ATPase